MLQRFLKLLFLFLIFVLSLTGAGFYQLYSWSRQPIVLKGPKMIYFAQGMRLPELSGVLASEGMVEHALFFHLYVRLLDDYSRFQAGNYRFEGEVSPLGIAETIRSGKTYVPIQVQYTIPEGFNLNQIAARLAVNGVDSERNLLRIARDKVFIKEMGIDSPSLEGYLYPATYSFSKRPTAEQALKEMVRTFWDRLPENYVEEAKKLGLTLQQAVTFASLIEMETLHEDERPKVSEVIWQRLKKGSPLGIDAALIYGIKGYKGDIKWEHLKDAKNLYNTRIHKGLPPTPIGSPSRASLLAVLNPSNEGYYYYVLNTDGDRRHHFSKSLSEHNKYVKILMDATKRGQSQND